MAYAKVMNPDAKLSELQYLLLAEALIDLCGNDTKETGRELLIMNYKDGAVTVMAPEAVALGSLTPLEATELSRHEEAIARSAQSFVAAGLALRAIRDSGKPSGRLYRAFAATFEDYCRIRFGMSENFANKLIRSATSVERIKTGTNVPVLPANEAQARELARLPEDKQPEAWQAVVEAHDRRRHLTPSPVDGLRRR